METATERAWRQGHLDGYARALVLTQPVPMKLAQNLERLNDETLTPAHLRILQLMAEGCTRKEAGRRFGITEETVKFQLRQIRERLYARNTTHAVAVALRAGLIA